MPEDCGHRQCLGLLNEWFYLKCIVLVYFANNFAVPSGDYSTIVFVTPANTETVIAQEAVKFTCHAFGQPPPETVTWHTRKGALIVQNNKYDPEDRNLTIFANSAGKSRTAVCHANNSVSVTNAEESVTVFSASKLCFGSCHLTILLFTYVSHCITLYHIVPFACSGTVYMYSRHFSKKIIVLCCSFHFQFIGRSSQSFQCAKVSVFILV